jgi:hydroxysqualene dehydroxylase
VAVVGGGLAGISAALACADAGAQVTLFEKRSRLGGLTWSFSHDGLTMDNGQHVFLRCCTAYLGFLDRIGSTGDVALQDRLDVNVFRPRANSNGLTSTDRFGTDRFGTDRFRTDRFGTNGLGAYGHGPAQTAASAYGPPDRAVLRRDRFPAPLHLGRSLLGYRLLPLGARLRLGLAAVPLARLDLDDPALDQQTFASWLAQHGQGEAAVSALWDLICLPTVNLPAREASLSMAAKVFQTGLLTDSGAGDIGWSRVPLGVLHGERAASALSRAGVQLRLGESVIAVDRAQADQVGADSDPLFEVRATNEKVAADGVVVALPHYCTEEVLPEGVLPANVRPSRLASSPIVNVHVHFDRRVTELPFIAGLGTEAQWVFDRTASSGASTGQYLAVSISAADSCIGTRPEDLVPQVVASLRALLPAARPAQVLSSFVTKEHQATFRATPGSAAHRAATRTRAPGLVLAGAWTATGWPPTMEGAVRSGVNAARAVLVATGLRHSLPPLRKPAGPGPRTGPGGELPLRSQLVPPNGQEQQEQPATGPERASGPIPEPVKLEEVV